MPCGDRFSGQTPDATAVFRRAESRRAFNRMRKYISQTTLYYFLIAGSLVAFQQLWRLILLVRTTEMAEAVPTGILARSFLVGLRFDLAIAKQDTSPYLLRHFFSNLEFGCSGSMFEIPVPV